LTGHIHDVVWDDLVELVLTVQDDVAQAGVVEPGDGLTIDVLVIRRNMLDRQYRPRGDLIGERELRLQLVQKLIRVVQSLPKLRSGTQRWRNLTVCDLFGVVSKPNN